jgi:hypothetical protein
MNPKPAHCLQDVGPAGEQMGDEIMRAPQRFVGGCLSRNDRQSLNIDELRVEVARRLAIALGDPFKE